MSFAADNSVKSVGPSFYRLLAASRASSEDKELSRRIKAATKPKYAKEAERVTDEGQPFGYFNERENAWRPITIQRLGPLLMVGLAVPGLAIECSVRRPFSRIKMVEVNSTYRVLYK